jgi:uncharacterized protein YhfF
MTPQVYDFWQNYLCTVLPGANLPQKPKSVFGFGDSAHMATELGLLVKLGIKTATCSALADYEKEETALPQKGELAIVIDGRGEPMAVIEITEVFITKFNNITYQFAFEEGEGDRSLNYWRHAHRRFFGRQNPNFFNEEMLLVCERFQVRF